MSKIRSFIRTEKAPISVRSIVSVPLVEPSWCSDDHKLIPSPQRICAISGFNEIKQKVTCDKNQFGLDEDSSKNWQNVTTSVGEMPFGEMANGPTP